jgi:hypothetical protein
MEYLPLDFNKLDEIANFDLSFDPASNSPSMDEQLGSFPSSQNALWTTLSNDNEDSALTTSLCHNLDPNNLFLDLFSLPNSAFPSDSASPTDLAPELFLDGSNTNGLNLDSADWLSMSKQPFDLTDVSLFALDPCGSNVTGHFPPDPRFEFGNLECISSDPQPNGPFMVENDPYSFLQSTWLSGSEPSSAYDPNSPSSKRVINLKVLDHQVNELFSTQNQQSQSSDSGLNESALNSDCSTTVSISNSVCTTASASPISTPPPLSTRSSSENTRPAPYHINIRPKPAHQPILPLRNAPLQPLSQSKVPISSNNNSSSKPSSSHSATSKSMKTRNKRHAHPEIRKHPNPTDVSRPYQCEILGCGKNFLNKNGLRYHYQEGTCDNAPLNDEDKFKPRYPCLVPGCTRVFKSANGLSYHKSHIHFPHLLNGNGKDINMSKLKDKDMMSPNLPQTYNSLKRKGILGGRIDGHCNRDSSLSASASGTTTIKSQHLDSIMANLAKRPLFSRHLSHLGTNSLRFASTSLGNFNFGKPSISANSDSGSSLGDSKAPPAKLPRLLPKPEALDVVA